MSFGQRGRAAEVLALTIVIGVVLGLAGLGLATRVSPAWAAVTEAERHPRLGCAPHAVARLVFGLRGPGGVLSDREWEAFLAGVVTPRFPDGLTVMQATGQWRGTGPAVEREPSRVVEIVHKDVSEASERLDEIVAIYKARYGQESVMVTHTDARVCF